MAKPGSWLYRTAIAAVLAPGLAGCFGLNAVPSNLPPTSLQTLEYYPRLVKGFQGTYPARRVTVLAPTDAREFKDASAADHQPLDGNSAIGVTLNQNLEVIQRLYSAALVGVVHKAIEQAADEAGLVPLNSGESTYAAAKKMGEDYVLETRVTRCWTKKRRGPDSRYGPTWFTTAEFTVDATLYKPPFRIPFWQGRSPATYDDPPVRSYTTLDDDTGIYDEPGQVLSIALTRAIAGIFKRDDLRTLVTQDTAITPHRN